MFPYRRVSSMKGGNTRGKQNKVSSHPRGIDLQTPLKDNMVDTRPKKGAQQITSSRRTIEIVIPQLADRFQIQSIKVKNLWYLLAKVGHKVLAQICWFFTINSLQFETLTSKKVAYSVIKQKFGQQRLNPYCPSFLTFCNLTLIHQLKMYLVVIANLLY